MKPNEVINKIKTALSMKVELEQAKLDDGVTVIESDSFEPGSEVFIVMEDERVALPIGEYMLDDGRMLMVEKEGIIAKIGEQVSEEESEEVVEPQLSEPMPKKIIESQVREMQFEEEKPAVEEKVEETIETVESVEEEIVAEASAIIDELTPESVTEADSSEMAVAVVEAVIDTLDEMPEETQMSFGKKKRKYGKKKLESEQEVIKSAETEIVVAVADVIDSETPEEVSPEVAEEIASVVVDAVQEIVSESSEELKSQLLKKKVAEKLSRVSKNSKKRVELAKERIAKLNAKKRKPASKKITHNPSKRANQKVEFQYAKNRQQSTLDRVMNKLFN